MPTTRILWINDTPDSDWVVKRLEHDYDVKLETALTNQEALERAKDSWNISFYDIGMDPGSKIAWDMDLPVARKLREILGKNTKLIGASAQPVGFYKERKEYFDDIVDTVDISRNNSIGLFELLKKHHITLERRVPTSA